MLLPLSGPPTAADILATAEAIAPYIHRTPILRSAALDEMAGAELYFKCENFQKIGAFKMRGGISAALRLTNQERQKGLATHSSGNHAQAVAKAASLLGVPAYIVMPYDAPKVKIAAVKGYGAHITYCNNTPSERQAALDKIVAETAAHFIHPYNDWAVIAGQATAAKEMLEDIPTPLDLILAPVGGGGLLSGTALAAQAFSPQTPVHGAEPAQVDDAFRSLQSGQIEQNEDNRTIADGLRTTLGDKTLSILLAHVPTIYRVSEAEIVIAMRHIWERMKIIIEPSCAVPFAAVLKHQSALEGQKIGIILTGGNVDVANLPF